MARALLHFMGLIIGPLPTRQSVFFTPAQPGVVINPILLESGALIFTESGGNYLELE